MTQMAMSQKYFYSEIAIKLGKRDGIVRHRAMRLGLPSQPAKKRKIGEWNRKHWHLREKVMRYFLNHSAEQCQKKFNLTQSEFKSLMTVSYRRPEFKHLRKETRTHAPFELKDWLFMLKRCGLHERGWIAKKMGRSKEGRFHSVKERLRKVGGGTSKFLNGMPLEWATRIWPDTNFKHFSMKTKAGPRGKGGNDFKFVLVPWVTCEVYSNKYKTPKHIYRCIRAMSKFQQFIFRKTNAEHIARDMRNILGEK